MPDMSSPVATRRDDLHTLTLRELEAKIALAGIVMSRRQIMRHCKAGTFDAQKFPAANNVEEWFIAPASVDKGIADITALQAHRARRDASRRDIINDVAVELEPIIDTDMSGHDAASRDVTVTEIGDGTRATEPDTSRRVAAELEIYDHPYVKRLETQVERLEKKYDDQVRRTEEIQLKGQQQLVELQRMTAVGQSQTLADFMLKARNWVLGQNADADKGESRAPVDN